MKNKKLNIILLSIIFGVITMSVGSVILFDTQLEQNTKSFQIIKSDVTFDVEYFVNNMVDLKNIHFDEDAGIISFDIYSNNENNSITILFPNELHLNYIDTNTIFDPLVLINGEEIVVNKTYFDEYIEIEFNYNLLSNKVEIILVWY